MRACANHPWRVMIAWVGIIAALIVLVATVGGSLKDEFEIPGSDTQKATDLIEAEFASEQGGVLNLVFAAPEGERLDTPERKAAIEEAIASSRRRRVRADRTDEARGHRLASATLSATETFSDGRADRVRGGAVRPRDLRRRIASRSSPCRRRFARPSSRSA